MKPPSGSQAATPLPEGSDVSRLSLGVSSYSERLDADVARFQATWRRSKWRFALFAVPFAALIVAFGIWGFRFETNSRIAVIHPRPAPPGSAVMVVINPNLRR